MGCHFPLQQIFLTQGLNPRPVHLLHLPVDSLPLSHLRSSQFNLLQAESLPEEGAEPFYHPPNSEQLLRADHAGERRDLG